MNMKQSLLNISSQLKESAGDYHENCNPADDIDHDETSSDLLPLFIERDDQTSTSTESSTYVHPFPPITKTSNLRPEAKEFIYNPIATMTPHAHSHGRGYPMHPMHPHDAARLGVSACAVEFHPFPTQYIPYTVDTHRLLFMDGAALQRSNLSQEIKNFFIKNYKISATKQNMKQETVEMIKLTLNALQQGYVTQIIAMHSDINNTNGRQHSNRKHMFMERMFLEKMRSIANYGEAWDVFVFGSESWNTQSIDSDVDVAIQLPFYTNRTDKMFLLQQLITALRKRMKHAAKGKNKNNKRFKKLKLKGATLLPAKYPIIRMEISDIQFDISIADEYCLRRKQIISAIIDEFIEAEIPIKELIVFIKHWSKQRQINNSYKRYLNSFGYTLLTINYLQFVIRNVTDKKYYDLSYLVYGFFSFYVNHYDVTQQSTQILHYCDTYLFRRKRNRNCLLEIIDPANIANNIAKNVGYTELHRIRNELYRCYQMCNLIVMHRFIYQLKHQSIFQKLTQSAAVANK